jgi:hypothetical protein
MAIYKERFREKCSKYTLPISQATFFPSFNDDINEVNQYEVSCNAGAESKTGFARWPEVR